MTFMDVLRKKSRSLPYYIKNIHRNTNQPTSVLYEVYDILENPEMQKLLGTNILKIPYLPKGHSTVDDYIEANSRFKAKVERTLSKIESKLKETSNFEGQMSQVDMRLIADLDEVSEYLEQLSRNLHTEERPQMKVSQIWIDTFSAMAGLESAEKEIKKLKEQGKIDDVRRIVDKFFSEGVALRGAFSTIFLQNPNSAKFDVEDGEWKDGEELAYRIYNGQSAKNLYNQLMEKLGFPQIPYSNKFYARENLEAFAQFDYEGNIDKFLNVVQSTNNEDYLFLFEEDKFDEIENMLYELVDDAVEKHDSIDMSPNEELDPNDEKEMEKYLTAVEFLVAVMKERGEEEDLEQKVFVDLEEIDRPREFDSNRRFPNLEAAHDVWDEEE